VLVASRSVTATKTVKRRTGRPTSKPASKVKPSLSLALNQMWRVLRRQWLG